MSIVVEVNLRIPSLMVREPGKSDQKIDNSNVRFAKRITVERLPKPGDRLSLEARGAEPFEAALTRADWSEDKEMFVVSCTYGKRSIAAADHQALLADPDWTITQLP